MNKKVLWVLGGGLFILISYYFLSQDTSSNATNVRPADSTVDQTRVDSLAAFSQREVLVADTVRLPLPGSAPTENVRHTIAIDEIRQGCFVQDCIPSIDEPEFISGAAAAELLPPESIGIALSYQGIDRFYPFPMLETHELVNDTVAGDALLVSYCPLCGTGIVFDRTIDGIPTEFGVSGMLWQSNLLMYNRADDVVDRNLWSQVLGEAVVGDRAGEQLTIIASDIMQFDSWRKNFPGGEVLRGTPQDPYNGEYYRVASNFAPRYDASISPLAPDAYVYGVVLDGVAKAYPRAKLPEGITTDEVGGVTLTVERTQQRVTFIDSSGTPVPDVEGFWFSWQSAHPETLIWSPQ